MAAAAPDSMRDALATLTRFSAELSHVLDDGRRRRGAPRSAGAPALAGAHLPVFARVASAPPSAGTREAARAPTPPPRRASVADTRITSPAPQPPLKAKHSLPRAAPLPSRARPPRGDGRRRRRDRYRAAAAAGGGADHRACFVTGAPVASLFDVDDYLITHDDHLWAAPALAGAESAARDRRARARAAASAQHRASRAARLEAREGFFDNDAIMAAAARPPTPPTPQPASLPSLPPRPARPPRPPPPVARPADLPRARSGTRSSVPARASRKPSPAPPGGRNAGKENRDRSNDVVRPRRAPVRAATLQPGRASLGARAAQTATPRAPSNAEATASASGAAGGAASQFVPGEDTQFVKQQSYCKTGNLPGLRRTRFLRLKGWELECYSRDLNRQLWSNNVQHSFLKVSAAQRKVTVFCVGARRPISFYLASNDMLASWSRALARASVAGTPRKVTSQKTAKEMQRDGMLW